MSRRQVVSPRVRAQVIKEWGNECWLGLPGCTHKGEEDDHIVPHANGGLDTVENIRRACKHCNSSRSDRILSGFGANIHAVIGPPIAGKTEYALTHMSTHGLILDYERIQDSLIPLLGPPAPYTGSGEAAAAAWASAYRVLTRLLAPTDVWIVRTLPISARHPLMLDEWIALDYDIQVIDPGIDETFQRIRGNESITPMEKSRLESVARQWYSMGISQAFIDGRAYSRRSRLCELGLKSDPESPARPRW